MNYFNKLPTIDYNGYSAKNLLARAVISDVTRQNDTIFYPYTIQDDDGRMDSLSNSYYDSPGYTWLIWHTNNVIDPYYGTTISDQDLYSLIVSKYGSFSNAERTIAFYRSNWETDSRKLSQSEFNGLPQSEKKYWDCQIDLNYQVIGYIRKKEDTIVNTNKIIRVVYESTNSSQFAIDELVSYQSTNRSARGFVTLSDTGSIMLQHITGVFQVGDTIRGETSGATATVTSVTLISQTSAGENPTYWESVSFAEYEQQENEKKRDIMLLDNRYKSQIENELKRVMVAT
jgi:hypothetical protein